MIATSKGQDGTDATTSLDALRELASRDPNAALARANELLTGLQVPDLLRLVAYFQRQLGNNAAGEAAEMLAIQTSFANALLQHADMLAQSGRSEESASILARHIESHPEDLFAQTILGEALLAGRHFDRAEEIGRLVVGRAPAFVRGRILLGKALMLQCRLAEALQLFEVSLLQRPEDASALEFLADLLIDAGKFDEASTTYKQLLSVHGTDAGLWVNYALALRFAGRRPQAEQAFRQALLLDETNGSAWSGLASMSEAPASGEDFAALGRALEHGRDPVSARHLHYAAAALLDRAGQYEEAFRHFTASNKAARRVFPYDPSALSNEVDESTAIFTKEFFAERNGWGEPSPAPIFVVGMPRSGSTMVERVLGGHSAIEATGELPVIPRMVDELDGKAGRPGGYRELVAKLSKDEVKALGEDYLRRAREFRRADKPLFTDKLHVNWRHLGLIRLILPNAKIIDVRRKAIDCAWSNYRTLFAGGHPASHDLRHIGDFYRDYRQLMEHFIKLSPDDILIVRYEQVVENLEDQARRVLDFLGLDYEAACLDFHLLSDPVATASAEQVRRPINREGIGIWKRYAAWLAPLVEALGPYADEEESV